MTAVDPELRREMLERELHGIDVELEAKRIEYRVLIEQITRLEADRADVVQLLEPENTLF